ncbi:MAG: CRS1/YhbY domain protein [Clostridia bacterium]|nr:CRS1/YhbY domain protein [Clostridia bacterium]
MITTKQRAYLRGLANKIDTIIQIGKSGIIDNIEKLTDEALEARELIKIKCLENSLLSPRTAAQELAEVCHAEIVQVIGSRIVLYRSAKKDPKIVLPE